MALATGASATVVNFDDLTGGGVVADGYGGINWGGQWDYYDSPQDPYTPQSPNTRIYTTGNASSGAFSFATAVHFAGAYISGFDPDVSFQMFYNSLLVATSSVLNPTSTPAFLSSGYAGLVDEVVFSTTANLGFFVVDDVTYSVAAVPIPAAAWLLLGGVGALAAVRRRKASV